MRHPFVQLLRLLFVPRGARGGHPRILTRRLRILTLRDDPRLRERSQRRDVVPQRRSRVYGRATSQRGSQRNGSRLGFARGVAASGPPAPCSSLADIGPSRQTPLEGRRRRSPTSRGYLHEFDLRGLAETSLAKEGIGGGGANGRVGGDGFVVFDVDVRGGQAHEGGVRAPTLSRSGSRTSMSSTRSRRSTMTWTRTRISGPERTGVSRSPGEVASASVAAGVSDSADDRSSWSCSWFESRRARARCCRRRGARPGRGGESRDRPSWTRGTGGRGAHP